MRDTEVHAHFVIYFEEQIMYQGSFEVHDYIGEFLARSFDGGTFHFRHSVDGDCCLINLTYSTEGSEDDVINLRVPINRSKIKWKQVTLRNDYIVRYRCAYLDWDTPKMAREREKIRRKSLVNRSRRKPQARIVYFGDPQSEDNT